MEPVDHVQALAYCAAPKSQLARLKRSSRPTSSSFPPGSRPWTSTPARHVLCSNLAEHMGPRAVNYLQVWMEASIVVGSRKSGQRLPNFGDSRKKIYCHLCYFCVSLSPTPCTRMYPVTPPPPLCVCMTSLARESPKPTHPLPTSFPRSLWKTCATLPRTRYRRRPLHSPVHNTRPPTH